MNIQILNLNEISNKIEVKKGEHNKIYFFHKGSISLPKIDIILDELAGDFEISGAILLQNNDEANIETLTHHLKGNTNCRINIKTVLRDSAKWNYEGMIKIAKNAHLTDSYLQQDNLVIGENVICNTMPQLEIDANDVKASHGATVGGFDKNQLYYLQSRGLSLEAAQDTIAEGFLAAVYGDHYMEVLKHYNIESLIGK